MSKPWKEVVRRGTCHDADFGDDLVFIVSVDQFEDTRWKGESDRYNGKTWYVVVFPNELQPERDEPSVHSFWVGSTDPYPTIEDALRRADELVPKGITWEILHQHERHET